MGFFFCLENYDRNPCCRALIRPEMLVIPQTYYFDSGENPNILLHEYNAELPIGVIPKLSLGRLLQAVRAASEMGENAYKYLSEKFNVKDSKKTIMRHLKNEKNEL